MKKTLVKSVGYTLGHLLSNIDLGVIGLPDLQRPFVWPDKKARDLFDSMYRGYPIGYLLFWENIITDQMPPTQIRNVGTNAKQNVPSLLIVDGQQRLTALYAVVKDISIIRNRRKEKIKIAFQPVKQKFDVANTIIENDPEWIPDISKLWSVDTGLIRFANNFINTLRKKREVSIGEEDLITEAIGDLHGILNYPFTVLQLSSTMSEDQVAEVFVRVNSKGTPLNQADFILTLMSVFWDDGRAQLERFCESACNPSTDKPTPYNHFIQPAPDQLLRVSVALAFRRARLEHVYSILRGKDLQTGNFLDEKRDQQFAVLKDAQTYVLNLNYWDDFFKAIERAGFRRHEHISSQNALLYTYAFYLIGKRDFNVDDFNLRNLIARWFFMVSITGRYTSSPESRMEQDLANLRDIHDASSFAEHLNATMEQNFTEDYWKIVLPNNLATSSARSPELFAYYAALNLLDAKVLFSELKVAQLMDPTKRSMRSATERHHLFPKKFLESSGLMEKRKINQIANYALLEWRDNDGISDKSPREYLPLMLDRMHHSEDELKKIYFWHALPEGWEEKNYTDFLEERRKLMASVIRTGFETLNKVISR
ncbi:MAG: DUF262 domain-containing protein [Methanothrix sp.]